MKRLINSVLILAIVAAVIASFAYLGLDLEELGSATSLKQMGLYVARFLSPDLSADYLRAILRGSMETLAMSALGTLLAAVLGLLFALPAAGRFGWFFQSTARLVLNALRAIPELVWAALMVLAAGLGPNAGTLALALHTTGVLGRLFAEALENTPPEPADAIRLQGGNPVLAFCYGTLPNLAPQLLAYCLYRWENNIRMASV
ncbi:phosphate/phosphonate ABC transporter permease, partial [Pseudomonas glycinae]|uniref:phosphate/phosphonate ABC transporter permease n=1 Tax=Pseudomonas glycinae TaxID=1785145 RepID=UPI001F2764D4